MSKNCGEKLERNWAKNYNKVLKTIDDFDNLWYQPYLKSEPSLEPCLTCMIDVWQDSEYTSEGCLFLKIF